MKRLDKSNCIFHSYIYIYVFIFNLHKWSFDLVCKDTKLQTNGWPHDIVQEPALAIPCLAVSIYRTAWTWSLPWFTRHEDDTHTYHRTRCLHLQLMLLHCVATTSFTVTLRHNRSVHFSQHVCLTKNNRWKWIMHSSSCTHPYAWKPVGLACFVSEYSMHQCLLHMSTFIMHTSTCKDLLFNKWSHEFIGQSKRIFNKLPTAQPL